MEKDKKDKPSFFTKMIKLTEDTAKNVYDDAKKAVKYVERKVDEKYDQIIEQEKREEMQKQQQQQMNAHQAMNVQQGYPMQPQVNQMQQQPGVQLVYQSNPGQEYYTQQMQNKR